MNPSLTKRQGYRECRENRGKWEGFNQTLAQWWETEEAPVGGVRAPFPLLKPNLSPMRALALEGYRVGKAKRRKTNRSSSRAKREGSNQTLARWWEVEAPAGGIRALFRRRRYRVRNQNRSISQEVRVRVEMRAKRRAAQTRGVESTNRVRGRRSIA